ncbi:MAG: Bax inhibitor-1/YccA family protein [Magnetococcales bacterium]|nr:Bax inhibitor-1/YccA family protein [Magnetococcales bacterium]
MNDPRRFSTQQNARETTWEQNRSGTQVDSNAVAYLKQVYALLSASLIVATAAGYVGMRLPFAYEHPILLIVLQFAALFIAFKFQNTATLFLFTGLSGLSIGPVIAVYVGAGLSGIIGQAVFMTAAVFIGTTFYSLTTKRDLSMMGGMLMAGLIVLIVGSLINMFMQSSALLFATSAAGALIFSGFILYETQMLKNNPWAVAPSVAALSMYLNIINLFLSLLRLLGVMGEE